MELLRDPVGLGVGLSHGDQCQYGAGAQRGAEKGRPILKPTGFLSNSIKVLEGLSRRCEGRNGYCFRPTHAGESVRHASCTGIRATDAARYPRPLRRAMLKGVAAQLREDDLLKAGCCGIQVPDDDAEVMRNMVGPAQGHSGNFRDDLSGQVLKRFIGRRGPCE